MHPRSRARAGQSGIDGESLQADVMRFMAIIGFCLVAIMGLVRDAVPLPALAPEVPVLPEPTVNKVLPVIGQVAEVEPPAPAPAAIPVAIPEPGVPVVAEAPQRLEISEQPEPPEPLQEPVLPIAAAAPPPAAQAPATATATAAEEEEEEEEGLSLRFDSDRDFLRLLTAGEVSLYLFNGDQAFRLQKNFAFRESPPPQQLYEVLPQTIPSSIHTSAEGAVADTSRYQWGVVMPARIQQRIASLVAVESSGQLVIDRFGTVRHQSSLSGGAVRRPTSGGHG